MAAAAVAVKTSGLQRSVSEQVREPPHRPSFWRSVRERRLCGECSSDVFTPCEVTKGMGTCTLFQVSNRSPSEAVRRDIHLQFQQETANRGLNMLVLGPLKDNNNCSH